MLTSNPIIKFNPFLSVQKVIRRKYDIDTEIEQLSSRKLWDVLRLAEIKGCELDAQFINQIKIELITRDDFNEGEPWAAPH